MSYLTRRRAERAPDDFFINLLERDGVGLNRMIVHPLVPAKAGIQWTFGKIWVPAIAGTSDDIDLKPFML